MSVKFRPMPWLTGIVAIMLVILISLGMWQYQRLQWKTDLLAEVEASVTAPSLTSLDDLERAIKEGDPVDFRRIAFVSSPTAGEPVYAVYRTQQGGIYWDLFQRYGGIYGRYDTVIEAEKPGGDARSPANIVADVLVGYVREDHPMGRVEAWSKSKPNLEKNRWFKFNQTDDWGDSQIRLSHYIEIEEVLPFNTADRGASAAEDLPVRRPSIRNNHRDYMLTWFSFAFLLIIFYGLIHRRAGRLSW